MTKERARHRARARGALRPREAPDEAAHETPRDARHAWGGCDPQIYICPVIPLPGPPDLYRVLDSTALPRSEPFGFSHLRERRHETLPPPSQRHSRDSRARARTRARARGALFSPILCGICGGDCHGDKGAHCDACGSAHHEACMFDVMMRHSEMIRPWNKRDPPITLVTDCGNTQCLWRNSAYVLIALHRRG